MNGPLRFFPRQFARSGTQESHQVNRHPKHNVKLHEVPRGKRQREQQSR